jgi:uncharacterized membrane protein YbhN (UPF0104 family)
MESVPKKRTHRPLIVIIVLTLFIYFLIPQLGSLQSTFAIIRDANLWYIFAGIVGAFLTFAAATLSYKALIFVPIKQSRLLLIQLASGFTSKLVPSAAG